MLNFSSDSSQIPVKFDVTLQIFNEEALCNYEKSLLNSPEIKKYYNFFFVKAEDGENQKSYISFENHILGMIHGNISTSFLEKMYPRILETYKDYVSYSKHAAFLQMH